MSGFAANQGHSPGQPSGSAPEPVGTPRNNRIQNLTQARSRARTVLFIERLIPRIAPATTVVGSYVLAGLARVPQSLPDGAHLALLLGTTGLTAWLLRRGLTGVEAPTVRDADRKIEQASGLRNRPLASLTDHSSGIGSNALWVAHQARLVVSLGPLRAGLPRPAFAPGDPWRASVLLVPMLVVGLVFAGSHAPGRIEAAFVPGWDDPDVPLPHVEAWITPPAYAPAAPVFLSSGAPSVRVDAGSVLTATVTGLNGAPVLGAAHVAHETIKALDKHSWRLDATLEQSGALVLRGRGRTIARWDVNVTPDSAPSIVWGSKPGGMKGSRRTRLPYEAHHAYGLDTVVAEIKLAHPRLLGNHSRVLRVPIPLSGHPVNAKGVITPDLSSDPWAGEEVSAVLVARSVSHQEARSAPATFTLGSRQFHSPVARAVLDLRRRLALGEEARNGAADDLAALGDTPGPLASNTGMFLNLTAIAALLADQDVADDAATDEAVGRLWDLALDIEDHLRGGDAGAQASIDVRAAQEAVAEQLRHMREDNAHGPEDQAELQRRMEALQQAIARKMQALTEQALKDKTVIPDLPGLAKSGNDAFQRLMQRLQDDAAEGHSDGAMDKLQQLEDSIEGMRNATPKDMAQLGQQLMARQKLREQTDGLRDIVRQQTKLLDHVESRLDRTRRAEQQRDAQGRMDDGDEDLATMSTQELLRRLGVVPPQQGNDGAQGQQSDGRQNNEGADSQGQSDGDQRATNQNPDGQTAPDQPAQGEHMPGAQANSGPAASGSGQGGAEAGASDARQSDRATQHALGRATDELRQEFKDLTGKEPPAFSKAADAMRDARHALAQGSDGDAVTAEQKALQALQQGGQQMRDSLKGNGSSGGAPSFLPSLGSGDGSGDDKSGGSEARRGGSGGDDSDEAGENDQQGDRDPLGRATGEGADPESGTTHIPDTISRERAHEIEQELRRRDSERTRPRQELDYLDRLLKSF